MESIDFQCAAVPGLVSIIIPARNAARYIGATLASIERQTYENWEAIIVEDGTDDGTESLVRNFARRRPANRVEFSRNQRNRGAAYTRNLAFAKAAGEFVALLDADDRWLDDHLAASVKALRQSGKDIAYSTVPQSMLHRSYVTPSASVLRRQVLADVGPWSTCHRYCEDYDFWLRCVRAGKTFHYIGGCHCLYRKNHVGATTQRLSGPLEEVAETVERYMNMHLHVPGLRPKTCRKYAAKAYLVAANCHLNHDPRLDPSADKYRAARLTLKGWRLRPKRTFYLAKGLWLTAWNLVRRLLAPRPATPAPQPAPPSAQETRRAA
jgi:glycosyltransferase involved in cell wall biosynthesis